MRSLNKIIWLALLLFLSNCTLHKNREVKYKAYLINLEKSAERMEIAKTQLRNHNIPFERFEAVDGYKIEITDLKTKQKYTGQDLKDNNFKMKRWERYFIDCKNIPEANFVYFRTKKYQLTAGELGCMCSHRAVLTKAIKEKLDVILVFEDDVAIKSEDFTFLLYSSINQIPKNSVIFLDAHGPDVEYIKRNKDRSKLYLKLKGPEIYGNYAVIYDILAAKKVVSIKEEIMPIDNRVGSMINTREISGYLLNKEIVTYDTELGSHIKDMGRPH